MGLTRCEVRRALKEVQSGNFSSICYFRKLEPYFHWSSLRYDGTGDTALHCAARLGHIDTIKYLLTFTPSGVDCKNNDDKTALHEAAQFGHPDIVRVLIDRGAKIHALKRGDWTPLMLACTKQYFKTIQILVENGSAINYTNKDGWSCMHLAARGGCVDIVKYLADKGGDCKATTKNGRSVLHIAALHGRNEVVTFLLQLDVDVNARDSCGNTPLHEGVLGRNRKVCETLIHSGADFYCRNNVDFDILLLASSAGYNDMIEFVVNVLSFDVNKGNGSGFTALHCAARRGHRDTCEFLIGLGAKPDLPDNFGRVAFDYLKQELPDLRTRVKKKSRILLK